MSWSEEDKRDLLTALKSHGTTNLEEIQKSLPQKSVSEIRSMIQKYKQMAQSNISETAEEEAAVNQWIKVTKCLLNNSKDVDDLYSRLFKYIALFGDHTSDAGVNLNDCYFTISQLMKGESVKDLEPFTSSFLNRVLTDLAHKVDESDKTEMLNFMKNLQSIEDLRQSAVQSYSKKHEDSKNNPLRVPDPLLKMPQSTADSSSPDH